jgi:putative sugar O-methyltransferase
MLQLKHLLHPLRTALIARQFVANQLSLARRAYQGKRLYAGDARYDLERVAEGFRPRVQDQADDTKLLDRICSAYLRSIEQQRLAPDFYQASAWWEEVRSGNLKAVRNALAHRDLERLGQMYRNFFRDSCIAGLSGLALTLLKPYFEGKATTAHRHFVMSDALYRLDYWMERTGGRYSLADLSGPEVGNPHGVLFDGVLVRTSSEYQHYCAQKIGRLLEGEPAPVLEIGGGFGGAAYYLLRDYPAVPYINLDVPDSIALSAYYLSRCFPDRKILFYGEEDLSPESLRKYDIILMPLFALPQVPAQSVRITFSSHAMSDISNSAMQEYLRHIARTTTGHFWYIGNDAMAHVLQSFAYAKRATFAPLEKASSLWENYRSSNAKIIELLYQLNS